MLIGINMFHRYGHTLTMKKTFNILMLAKGVNSTAHNLVNIYCKRFKWPHFINWLSGCRYVRCQMGNCQRKTGSWDVMDHQWGMACQITQLPWACQSFHFLYSSLEVMCIDVDLTFSPTVELVLHQLEGMSSSRWSSSVVRSILHSTEPLHYIRRAIPQFIYSWGQNC